MAAIRRTFPAGTTDTPVVAVPAEFQGGKVTLSADGWPAGDYTFILMLSVDGGVTFPPELQRFTVFRSPFNFPVGKAHICSFSYYQFDVIPTHVKARVIAPATFTTTITLDAVRRTP